MRVGTGDLSRHLKSMVYADGLSSSCGFISKGIGVVTLPGELKGWGHLDMGHSATRKQGKLFLRLLMLTMREVLKPGGPIWDHDLFAECASGMAH